MSTEPTRDVDDVTDLDPCGAELRMAGVDGIATIARCTQSRRGHGLEHSGPIDRATWPATAAKET